jgi:hypothetical protein
MVLLIRFSQELILWDVNYKNKGESLASVELIQEINGFKGVDLMNS